MKFYKITNLTNLFGQCEYKSLNIGEFIVGSQGYSVDGTTLVVATNEENPPVHTDLTEITEAEYTIQRQAIEAERALVKLTIEQRIASAESTQAQILLSLVTGGLM